MNKTSLTNITSDLHGQYKDTKAWKAHLAAVSDLQPDTHVIIGDFLDCASVSRHAKSEMSPLTLGEEYDIGNNDLDTLEKKLGKTVKRKVFLAGNHEDRINAYAFNQAPNIGTALKSVQEGLNLEKRGWEYVPYEKQLKLGKLIVAHGYYVNQYSAAKHVNSFGHSIIVGHTHGHQSHVVTHGDSPHIGMTIGCLCQIGQKYLRGRPQPWHHGFGIVYHSGENFFPYFVPIVDGIAVFGGKVYGD